MDEQINLESVKKSLKSYKVGSKIMIALSCFNLILIFFKGFNWLDLLNLISCSLTTLLYVVITKKLNEYCNETVKKGE